MNPAKQNRNRNSLPEVRRKRGNDGHFGWAFAGHGRILPRTEEMNQTLK
jgi:hypothetical protein